MVQKSKDSAELWVGFNCTCEKWRLNGEICWTSNPPHPKKYPGYSTACEFVYFMAEWHLMIYSVFLDVKPWPRIETYNQLDTNLLHFYLHIKFLRHECRCNIIKTWKVLENWILHKCLSVMHFVVRGICTYVVGWWWACRAHTKLSKFY
jgi:hypothetical protein